MASFFSRLFRHVRFERSQSEGFALEALAEAIRRDPEPFLRALAARGWLAGDASAQVDGVATRARGLDGVGPIDLEVGLTVDGDPRTLRLELGGAADEAQTRVRGERIALLRRAWEREGRAMLWNDLRAQVRADAHVYWHELRAFLEEQQLADDADEPLRASSAAALAEAHAVIRTVARIAVAFAVRVHEAGIRSLYFPMHEDAARKELAHQFVHSGRMRVHSQGPPWVALGIELGGPQRHEGIQLAMWVEATPGDAEGRRALFAAAERGGLSEEAWAREPGDGGALIARAPVADELDQVEAVGWFIRRAHELAGAGVLEAARPAELAQAPVSGELF